MERDKQEERERKLAARHERACREYVFRCFDGQPFRAIAPSESGAFRVLNAERPGMHADLLQVLNVLGPFPSSNACADCGKHGEMTGHQDCQYPQDR